MRRSSLPRTLPNDFLRGCWDELRRSMPKIEGVEHKDDLPWFDAPKPRRWHRCRVQSTGWIDFTQYDRCPCGAVRINGRVWIERNSR
jgi:hypothetical protein